MTALELLKKRIEIYTYEHALLISELEVPLCQFMELYKDIYFDDIRYFSYIGTGIPSELYYHYYCGLLKIIPEKD